MWLCVALQLSEVVGNEEAIKRLRVIAAEGNMPNLILSVCGCCAAVPAADMVAFVLAHFIVRCRLAGGGVCRAHPAQGKRPVCYV